MSCPAQKLRPAPRSTTTLVAASRSARSNASTIIPFICSVMELSLSGRLSVTKPIPSCAEEVTSAVSVAAISIFPLVAGNLDEGRLGFSQAHQPRHPPPNEVGDANG